MAPVIIRIKLITLLVWAFEEIKYVTAKVCIADPIEVTQDWQTHKTSSIYIKQLFF